MNGGGNEYAMTGSFHSTLPSPYARSDKDFPKKVSAPVEIFQWHSPDIFMGT